MAEPEIALVFTPEAWVEELHRHLTDHGGGRVRQVVVEPDVALEESYDVLVVSVRWPALTRAFVADVHDRGRMVLGVFDREEPAARAHLVAIGVDEALESDQSPQAFIEEFVVLQARRGNQTPEPDVGVAPPRRGEIIGVGGPPGTGRTEIAIQLAARLGTALIDADDVAPCIAPRLGLPIEPNLRTAIDAAEHGRGTLDDSIVTPAHVGFPILTGLPNPGAWSQIRPGEVMRVVERVARDAGRVVVDGLGHLEDVGSAPRGRNAVARAVVVESDVVVGVCMASPVGVARFLAWAVDVHTLAPETPLVVAVNRAPKARFRRGELFAELTRTIPASAVVFAPDDPHVTDAAWDGRMVAKSPFVRAMTTLATAVNQAAQFGAVARAERDADPTPAFEAAS